MCFKKIKSWFTGIPSVPAKVTIPHPEESPDSSKTVTNTDLYAALDQWTVDYNVPEEKREYWKTKIAISLDANLPYPAGTYELDGVRHLTIRPEWVNSGVIAHEQAHNSYALMNEYDKMGFSIIHSRLKTRNPLIVYLYSINSYGLTNDVEGHAEVYRYLGEEMPAELKRYYPKLF